MKIAEFFLPYPSRLWTLAKQVGVDHAVGILPYDPPPAEEQSAPENWPHIHGARRLSEIARDADGHYPWDFTPLAALQARLAAHGLELAVIESSPPMSRVRLGLPGRDEELDQLAVMLRAMGRLGIGAWCYNFIPAASWGRTTVDRPDRGGALVTAFNLADAPAVLDLPDGATLTAERLWDNLKYFLDYLVPVAEEAGVRLALHPDDPPIPSLGGVPRIIHSVEAFDRVLDLAPSPANGLTLCQGNFALMTDDLPGLIHHFGRRGKIHFVHLRDVVGTADNFHETWHDLGPTDLRACLQAYQDIGFTGVLRPDHVPTLAGESNASPGYATLGRLFAVGYIRGLLESVYGKN